MRYSYLVLLVVALGLFWLTEETLEGEMRVVDTAVLSRFQVWRAPALDRLAVGLSLLGAAPGTLLMTILAYLKLARRDGRTLLVVMAGGTVLTVCLKQIFAVTRPSPVDSLLPAAGFSYPSGHALMARGAGVDPIARCHAGQGGDAGGREGPPDGRAREDSGGHSRDGANRRSERWLAAAEPSGDALHRNFIFPG